jgi:mediator of RNA polymerase II transcription subunit 8
MAQPITSPPPLNFEDTPIEDLEQLRPRLTQLTHSLRKLEETLRLLQFTNASSELTTIQNQFNVILQQLASLAKTLQSRRSKLDITTVFPNREFDTMSPLLFTLLRKKLTPEVEDWIKSAELTSVPKSLVQQQLPVTANSLSTQNSYNTAAATTNSVPPESLDLLESLLLKDDELTESIIEHAQESLEDYMFGGYLTKQELEQGMKVSDVLKDISKEDLESPSSTPPSTSITNSTSTSMSIPESNLLRFIYQGLDSNLNNK